MPAHDDGADVAGFPELAKLGQGELQKVCSFLFGQVLVAVWEFEHY